jgi:DNA polymerase-3 subunit beta
MVRNLPDNDITIEADAAYKTTVTCEKAKYNIVVKSGDDFSHLPLIEREESISVSQFTLKEVIRQTIFSIADNNTNKILTGELFEINDNVLKVVSSDGLRISLRKINLKNSYPSRKVIVPGKTLSEIMKILPGDTDKDVNIFFTDKHILFEFDNTTVVSRIIEGDYLKIDNILSADYETKVKINKREFQNCITRSALLVKEGDKKPIIMDIKDSLMELKMNSVVGSFDENIDITKVGKDIMIGFDPKFLIEALRVIDDEEIDIKLLNSKAPCFIRDDEETYTYLILPVTFSAVNNS